MNLLDQFEIIKKKTLVEKSKYAPGSVERVFEYNEKMARDESGDLAVCIKLEPEEKKKKKSIN
jgi:hypothetical protein